MSDSRRFDEASVAKRRSFTRRLRALVVKIAEMALRKLEADECASAESSRGPEATSVFSPVWKFEEQQYADAQVNAENQKNEEAWRRLSWLSAEERDNELNELAVQHVYDVPKKCDEFWTQYGFRDAEWGRCSGLEGRAVSRGLRPRPQQSPPRAQHIYSL
ncbi:unnamed protein product [Notodromas monacha]|uniref:Spt6 SH2 domain-containing protein n=1 Tax=Notodromas monacha TaxID=399045 RepID=A0A7R9BEE4_9CRUS|nr:unnamed protein product [Notodromas monacha]CAG0912617.1 unnamed protein product [Notodromas monacha]